jgi:hypothetical protein
VAGWVRRRSKAVWISWKAAASAFATSRQFRSMWVRSADSLRLELPTKATPVPSARSKT